MRTSPAGARVKIDGKDRGVTPLALRDLESARYTVDVTRSGYASESRRVQLPARGPSSPLELRLKTTATPPRRRAPASSASPTGRTSLELVTSLPRAPASSSTAQSVGTTPLRLVDVARDRRRFASRWPGYANWTTTVTLASGEPRQVAASLEPDCR